jgi:thiol-disulfide isomerase/thioredoxin
MIVNASNESFSSEINVEGKAVVQFHAEWCGPCKAFTPHFEAAAERDESTRYIRADIESLDRSILEKYEIMTIPRVIMFENGEVVKDINARTVYGLLEEING